MKRAHYFQHVPFEGLGMIRNWLHTRDYKITGTHWFENDDTPAVEEIDFLIVMGGPMSVHDENIHPWLKKEKAFIASCIERGTPVLGVCLGAQLIAASQGARIYPNEKKEIGWFPILSMAESSAFCFPSEMTVLHWHGETFDLPAGATLLASSTACRNQAFLLGKNVVGLQFHLEMNAPQGAAIVENCREELVANAPYVQSAAEIMAGFPIFVPHTQSELHRLLDFLLL